MLRRIILSMTLGCCVGILRAQPMPLPTDDVWWKSFNDALLLQLMDKAVAHNYDLLNAMANVEISKSQWNAARGAYYPSMTAQISYLPQKTSLGIDFTDNYYHTSTALLTANWEVDVFGRIRKTVKSQKELYKASQENYRAVMVSLCAQLATAYVTLRADQQRLLVAQHNTASQQSVMEQTQIMYETGLTSALDYAQSYSLYLQTQSIVPELEASVVAQINSIGVLIGTMSDSIQTQLADIRNIPSILLRQASNVPASLLMRRPDVQQAALEVDALTAQVGASRADWFPSFFVEGTFGYGADKFEQFFKNKNLTWKVAPTLSWTFFNGREAVEKTRIAQLNLDEGINTFNNTVLTAMQEVNSAIVAYNKSIEQLAYSRKALEQTEQTLQYALNLYEQGLTDYQNVLNAQVSVLNYENTFISIQSNVLFYFIQLYKVLGGGYEDANIFNQ